MIVLMSSAARAKRATGAIGRLLGTGCRLGEIGGAQWDPLDLGTEDLRRPDWETGLKTLHLGLAAAKRFEGFNRAVALWPRRGWVCHPSSDLCPLASMRPGHLSPG